MLQFQAHASTPRDLLKFNFREEGKGNWMFCTFLGNFTGDDVDGDFFLQVSTTASFGLFEIRD